MSPNTIMDALNSFEGSAENSIEAVSDQSVPVNLVSPPATESCHAQTTDEVAPFAIEFCCGTAGLTAQLRWCGLRLSHGVDRRCKSSLCRLLQTHHLLMNQMVAGTTTSVDFLVAKILEASFATLPAYFHELPCLHAWRPKAKADNTSLRRTRVDGA